MHMYMYIHVYKWLDMDAHQSLKDTLAHPGQQSGPMPSALVTWHESSVSSLVPYTVFFRFES